MKKYDFGKINQKLRENDLVLRGRPQLGVPRATTQNTPLRSNWLQKDPQQKKKGGLKNMHFAREGMHFTIKISRFLAFLEVLLGPAGVAKGLPKSSLLGTPEKQ